MKKIEAVGDHLVVKVIARKSPSGIILPDEMGGDDLQRGEVLSAGPDVIEGGAVLAGDDGEGMNARGFGRAVAPGDVVLFRPRWAIEVDVDGEKLRIIRARHVAALVREE